ncbi:MAG: 16S rRNA (adenine(1518)-N(6)/adenine(1519)-N(6))-dimethyltransferase RsmA [Bdellovibrionota bacterium]
MSTRKERLMVRLQELGVDPKRSLGQNFLISDHVVNKIMMAVKTAPFSEIIEVGPGLGAITEDILAVAKEKNVRLTLLELDRMFVGYWSNREEDLRVIEGDALKVDWKSLSLAPQTIFVSNLPYQISSSLVIERSLEPAGITRMILMFQKEVAQRIGAKAKTPEYGLLTVIAQTFWETATVCDAGPGDFFPPPNVSSRVLVFRERPVIEGLDRQNFLKFAKAGFAQRRKLLSKNLTAGFLNGNPGSSALLEKAFKEVGLLPTARAEELDPPTFVRLYQCVTEAVREATMTTGKND